MKLSSYFFVIPFVVAGFTQLLKIFIDVIKTKKFHRRQLLAAGGFPSVHSSISAGVTTLVFLKDGANSTLFAITLVFSFLFIYDAMNVRYEAGKHAHLINTLRNDLKNVLHEEQSSHFLKERLGHTPVEVFGGIILGSLGALALVKWLPRW